MKKPGLALFMLISFVAIFAGCQKSNLVHTSDFEKSHKEWLNFKKESGNSYQYTVLRSSWVGMSWQTVITVKAGKVVKRDFTWVLPDDWVKDVPADEKEWTENESEINSHEDSGAADAVTLDEIYAKAKNYWLKKRDHVKTYFEANNNGLISSCGFAEDGCVDDCFNGINIILIKKI